MKRAVYRALNAAGLPRLLAWANRRRAIILMYHGFTDRRDHAGIENRDGLHLHVDVFRQHLAYLQRHFQPISLEALLDALETGRGLPPRSVVLTFDDGYRSNYELAFPLLREFQVPATVFLTTDFVDSGRFQWTDRLEYAIGHADREALRTTLNAPANGDDLALRGAALVQFKRELKRVPQEQRAAEVDRIEASLGCALAQAADPPALYLPLNWAQVRAMRESGLVSFGNHTVSHFILSRCTEAAIRSEIEGAKRLIEERLGVACPLFCYPNGARGDYDERTRAIAQEVGHRCALVTEAGLNGPRADPFELRRVGVMEGHSFDDFAMAVAGVSRWSMALGEALRGQRS